MDDHREHGWSRYNHPTHPRSPPCHCSLVDLFRVQEDSCSVLETAPLESRKSARPADALVCLPQTANCSLRSPCALPAHASDALALDTTDLATKQPPNTPPSSPPTRSQDWSHPAASLLLLTLATSYPHRCERRTPGKVHQPPIPRHRGHPSGLTHRFASPVTLAVTATLYGCALSTIAAGCSLLRS